FFQAEDGIRDFHVTGVQTCALPICFHCTAASICWPRRSRLMAACPYAVRHAVHYWPAVPDVQRLTHSAVSVPDDPQPLRQAPRPRDAHALLSVQLAAFQAHLAFRHAEGLGQKGQQVGVGLALHRRRGEADLQAVAVQAGEFVLAGLGLQVAGEDQVLAIPAVPVRHRNGARICGMWVMAARLWMTSMSSRFSAMKAKIGEMSRPPRLGRKRRMGASSGSQICCTSSAAGLWVPGATQERITLMIRAKKKIFRNSEVTPISDHTSSCSRLPPKPTPSSARVTIISNSCTSTASTSEARSMPPKPGMMRRSGISSGEVARTMNWLSGL